jgi:hypothetical protein
MKQSRIAARFAENETSAGPAMPSIITAAAI